MTDESLWERIRPPLWARWGVALLVAAAAVVALVAFVRHNTDNGLAHVGTKAELRSNQEGEIVIGQDQAPHAVTVPAGGSARTALVRAVRADMRRQVAGGDVPGPLQSTGCRRTGSRAGRTAFRCRARAADVSYPFLAAASGTRAYYCKRDAPPVPSQNIPVSRRCRL